MNGLIVILIDPFPSSLYFLSENKVDHYFFENHDNVFLSILRIVCSANYLLKGVLKGATAEMVDRLRASTAPSDMVNSLLEQRMLNILVFSSEGSFDIEDKI